METPEQFVEQMWSGFSRRTRVVFISHIASQTALTFPVEEICRRAREAGVLSIVDGAHVPGQIPLDLSALGADIYTAACHKWLCAPKGSAFLFVRRDVQPMLEPLVVSWGWEAEEPSDSQFIDHHEWQGTRDPSAFLAVPVAIDFQRTHDWDNVREQCYQLASQTRDRILSLIEQPPICPDNRTWFRQMFASRLPALDIKGLSERLRSDYNIEVLTHTWNEQPFLRASFQAYNSQSDADALIEALEILIPAMRS